MDPEASTDAQLLAALRQPFDADARAAVTALFERHAPAVRGLLARLGGADEARREDWVHDTFLTAMRLASTFRAGNARPWLLTIAARHVRDTRRAERRRLTREEEVATERARQDGAPSTDCVEAAHDPDLAAHLAALPERYRVVLELRFVQGLPHTQVAEVLGVSLRTAHSRAAEALAALRARLESTTEVQP